MGDGYFFFLSGNQALYTEPAAALWMINDSEVLPDEGRNDPASCCLLYTSSRDWKKDGSRGWKKDGSRDWKKDGKRAKAALLNLRRGSFKINVI